MKNLLKNKSVQLGLSIFAVICLSILFFFFLYRIDTIVNIIGGIIKIFMPIIYGLVIAYILNPIIKLLENKVFSKVLTKTNLEKEQVKKHSRTYSIITASVIFFVVLYLLISYIIPEIIASIQILIGNVPNYINNIEEWLKGTLANNPDVSTQILNNYEDMSQHILNILNDSIMPSVNNIIVNLSNGVVGVFKFLYNFIIGFIISIYLLSGKEGYLSQTKMTLYSVFKVKTVNIILAKARYINDVFGKYMMGVLLDCCAIGSIMFLFGIIFQMPYALLIAVICAITNAIPYFGPYIGGIPSGLLILLVSPPKAIIFAIFVVILQQFDGMYLAPKIIGDKTGLKSFWVLCAILICGGFFGFIGLLIGVPIFAILYKFARDYITGRLKNKKLSNNTKKYENLSHIDNDGEYISLKKS